MALGVWLGLLSLTIGGRAAEVDKVVRGPFFSGTIRAKFPGENTAMKGVVVTVGAAKQAYVCYDTDLMRVSLGWTGNFLEFGNGQREISHPPPPEVKGTPVFGTRPGPGWGRAGDFSDLRPQHQGPLPKDHAKYRGLFVNGDNVVLSYTVGDCAVLEMPGAEVVEGVTLFTRTLNLAGPAAAQDLQIASERTEGTSVAPRKGGLLTLGVGTTNRLLVWILGAPLGADLKAQGDSIRLALPPLKVGARITVALARLPEGADADKLAARVKLLKAANLARLCKGGPARWTQPVVNHGVLGTNDGPYVVDSLPEPLPNPYHAKTFFGGFDFLPDGRAAVCTFHGDVWIVSGIDDRLANLTWRRFATGLFQPLGLKIVDGKIYITGRDQLTRLHDLNNDGEADYYECFNNDTVVTPNYHEFCLDLHTDSQGNFYYAKGAPWPPDVNSPHQGTMLKVSKDGTKLEVFATGLRAPNGMTVGPHDEVLIGDNQGHWMPASKLNLVKRGGFYGMMPSAHRSPPPTDFDKPICWVPYHMDNSSGGQVYVTSDKWGPFQGSPLFMSYGKCTLFHVMTEEVEGVTQAGMVQFPLKFQSGLMRARFHPRDGQLYASGLRGWQTSATRDGGLYRVRYTGKPVRAPVALHVKKTGVEITFSIPLDAVDAQDVGNYGVEVWNYIWSGNYGSPEISTIDPKNKQHDPLTVKSARLLRDGRTVFLEIPDLKPVDQMKIKFNLKSANGTAFTEEIYSTIHRLGS